MIKKHNQHRTGLITSIYIPYNYRYIHVYDGIYMLNTGVYWGSWIQNDKEIL